MRSVCSDLQKALSSELNGLDDQWFIAGGSVRDALLGRPAKDIDIFFTSQGAAETFIKRAFENSALIAPCQSANALNFWIRLDGYNGYMADRFGYGYGNKDDMPPFKVQAITSRFGEPTKVIADFDQTVNMVAWLPKSSTFVWSTGFPIDLTETSKRTPSKADYGFVSRSAFNFKSLSDSVVFRRMNSEGEDMPHAFEDFNHLEPINDEKTLDGLLALMKGIHRGFNLSDDDDRWGPYTKGMDKQVKVHMDKGDLRDMLRLLVDMAVRIDPSKIELSELTEAILQVGNEEGY